MGPLWAASQKANQYSNRLNFLKQRARVQKPGSEYSPVSDSVAEALVLCKQSLATDFTHSLVLQTTCQKSVADDSNLHPNLSYVARPSGFNLECFSLAPSCWIDNM